MRSDFPDTPAPGFTRTGGAKGPRNRLGSGVASLRACVDSLALAHVGSMVELTGEEAHHLVRVRRADVGTLAEAVDGRGVRAGLTVVGVAKQGREGWAVRCRVDSKSVEAPLAPRIEIWAAPPKGDRLPQMVEQLSQVGASMYVPLQTERGVAEASDTKLDRLRRITHESLKQCGRAWEMEIGDPSPLDAAFGTGATVLLAAMEGGTWQPPATPPAVVRVLIGPEGGLSTRELDAARRAGAIDFRLGPHVQRTETAAVCAAALLRAQQTPSP